jgi:hypothetical protein
MAEESETLEQGTAALLDSAGITSDFLLSPIAAGGNNRVFRIEIADGPLLLKSYFRDVADTRDRGGNEYRFSRYVWNLGVDCIPEPIAYDAMRGLGIYRFVEGVKLQAGEVRRTHLAQALEFFIRINSAASDNSLAPRQIASEACFSLHDHRNVVERRINSLRSGINPDESAQDREASLLVAGKLSEVWAEVQQELGEQVLRLGLEENQSIPASSRCISPSDFGFHNALVNQQGRLTFIDFEYAGWDDRAKMIGDFFCQPQVPINLDYFGEMVACAIPEGLDRVREIARVAALFPLYQVKWCCIMLNEFLALGSRRRQFAGYADRSERKREQLEKVKELLSQITYIEKV